jgi:hypothetical protein
MTPGRVNLKIVADRLGLARRYQADLETMKAMGALTAAPHPTRERTSRQMRMKPVFMFATYKGADDVVALRLVGGAVGTSQNFAPSVTVEPCPVGRDDGAESLTGPARPQDSVLRVARASGGRSCAWLASNRNTGAFLPHAQG